MPCYTNVDSKDHTINKLTTIPDQLSYSMKNNIYDAMVSLVASIAVDRGF
jgi:hypothetical protein